MPGASRRHVQCEGNNKKNTCPTEERRDEFEAYCEISERGSKCKELDRNHHHSEVSERVHRQRLGRPSTSDEVVQWRHATLTAWSRTQQTVSLSSAEAELYALTIGVTEGMVTKHLWQELRHDVILMNFVDSQSAKAWAYPREDLGE